MGKEKEKGEREGRGNRRGRGGAARGLLLEDGAVRLGQWREPPPAGAGGARGSAGAQSRSSRRARERTDGL